MRGSGSQEGKRPGRAGRRYLVMAIESRSLCPGKNVFYKRPDYLYNLTKDTDMTTPYQTIKNGESGLPYDTGKPGAAFRGYYLPEGSGTP